MKKNESKVKVEEPDTQDDNNIIPKKPLITGKDEVKKAEEKLNQAKKQKK